jgi:hypothetical protein
MKIIKVAGVGGIDPHQFKNQLIFKLIERISGCEIKFTSIFKADLIFIGPYYKFFNVVTNKILKKFFSLDYYVPSTSLFFNDILFNYKKKNKKIFLSAESYVKYEKIKADYYLTCFLTSKDNHFRIPYWKGTVDWPEYDIYFDSSIPGNGSRYGGSLEIKRMMEPLGNQFMNRGRSFCIFTSHMDYPRNEIYRVFKKQFVVDGYGSYFDKKIHNHNKSNFKKNNILKNYSFNLCPENNCMPGMIGQNVCDAFCSGSLAVTWTDRYIDFEYNKNAFINLIDYQNDNFVEIIKLLKDDNFLQKFTKEPLLKNKPNLEKEIAFVKQLLNSL